MQKLGSSKVGVRPAAEGRAQASVSQGHGPATSILDRVLGGLSKIKKNQDSFFLNVFS